MTTEEILRREEAWVAKSDPRCKWDQCELIELLCEFIDEVEEGDQTCSFEKWISRKAVERTTWWST